MLISVMLLSCANYQFYGHLPTDELSVQLSARNGPFGVAFMCSFLKPGNNPGFHIYNYDPPDEGGKNLLENYSQYILNLNQAFYADDKADNRCLPANPTF